MKILLFSLAALILVTASFSCSVSVKQPSCPDDFNFRLQYGFGPGNIVDTYNKKYTRFMGNNEKLEVNLKFTDSEMDSICREMQRIGVLDYPDVFNPPYSDDTNDSLARSYKPSESFVFHITMNGVEKDINWNDEIRSKSHKAVELRNLAGLIRRLAVSKPDIKDLPDSPMYQ